MVQFEATELTNAWIRISLVSVEQGLERAKYHGVRDGLSGLFSFISCSLSVLVKLSFSCSTIFPYSLVGFMAAFRRV